jgi:hypothetical protein
MSTNAMNLYELLPAVYRLRDAEGGYPLQALLEIIAEQVDVLKRDIDGLWDDFFIETCADWVVPYIGDLVGNNPLHEIDQGRRADVAKTIYYRRRKGVLPMLEELARDVTGWGAHAVAAFENLGWTQNVNHVRYTAAPNPEALFPNAVSRVGTVNLRHMDAVDRLDGPFDTLSHTIDVRPADRLRGWHNIRKINFFLWRLQQFPLANAPAASSNSFANGFYFSTLASPAPLFTNPEREAAETELATELHVAGPIRPAAFYFQTADFYGAGKSLAVYRSTGGGMPQLVPLSEILCADLSTWRKPLSGKVAVDVRQGRLAFADGEVPDQVWVDYNYGFSAEMGSGPYDRHTTLVGDDPDRWLIRVRKGSPVATLQAALGQWDAAGKPDGVIQIEDNGVYGGVLAIVLPENGRLVIEAANGVRPDLRLVGRWRIYAPAGTTDAQVTLNGLLIQGGLQLCGDVKLTLTHCTLVPGRLLDEEGQPQFPDLDSLLAEAIPGECDTFTDLAVTIDKSIVGPLRLPAECEALTIRDSIVQAPNVAGVSQAAIAADDNATLPGPPTNVERSTLRGIIYVKELTASEVIFNDLVQVERLQTGCVRFSYVPPGSLTPRRFRCQPDLALDKEARRLGKVSAAELTATERTPVLARVRPTYTSVHYGDPGYAQLGACGAAEIRTGAEDGSEMGVFSSLKQPQRETNLRIRLEEYLPFGLEPGLVYVT